MSKSYATAYYDCDVRFNTVEVKGVLSAKRVVCMLTETNSINLGECEFINKQEWRRIKNELAELRAKLEALSVKTEKELPMPSAPPGKTEKELPAPSAPPGGP